MSKKSVFCITTSRPQADQLVDHLKTASFSNKDVSVLCSDAGTSGALTSTLSWIAGIGSFAIPGVGPYIAAGPVMATFSGIAVGAVGGGIAEGLVRLGVPESEARHYEDRVDEGSILISVHTDDVGDIARATDIFHQAGAQDFCATGEASRPSDTRT